MSRDQREKLMKDDAERKMRRKRSFHQRVFDGRPRRSDTKPATELLPTS